MKLEKKNILLLLALALFPLVLTAVFYPYLPDAVPIHWNLNGVADNLAPKFPGAFIGPLTAILVTPLLVFLPRIDPRRKNYDRFSSAYFGIIVIFDLFCLFLTLVTIIAALSQGIPVDRLVAAGASLLLAAIGNFMPKFKQNFFCGIKNPWTLTNCEVWVKTHRLGGRMFFAGGILTAVAAIFLGGMPLMILLLSVVFAICVVPTVYSYLLFKKIPAAGGEEEED